MARKGKQVEAVAYIRTSSAANVGTDKDSDKRQRAAIVAFAKREGFALVDEFTDAAVKGTDPIEARPGFSALLDRIEGNGVRTVIIEDASRFARELMTQELGLVVLINPNWLTGPMSRFSSACIAVAASMHPRPVSSANSRGRPFPQ